MNIQTYVNFLSCTYVVGPFDRIELLFAFCPYDSLLDNKFLCRLCLPKLSH